MSGEANDSSLPTTTGLSELIAETATKIGVLANSSVLLNDSSQTVKTQLMLYDVLIPSFGGVIILLNLLVVISSGLILKKAQQPRSTYLFLGNVALTDLLTGVAVVFGQLFPREHRDQNMCALQLGMIVASTLTSIYSVGLIAVDRFLYILYGLQYQQWVYPMRVRLLIGATWVIGCVIGFLPLFGWYGNTDNGKICWFILLAPRKLILLTVCVGVVPILTTAVLYSIILYHATKKIMQIQNSQVHSERENGPRNLRMFRGRGGPSREEDAAIEEPRRGLFSKIFKRKPLTGLKSPSKWRAVKVVLFTTGSFVVTWCPYFIASVVYVYQCEYLDPRKKCKNLRLVIASPLAILGFANSLINPIIYAWWHKGFRTYVRKRVSTVIMKTRWKRSLAVYQASNSNTASTSGNNSNKTSVNRADSGNKEVEIVAS